jgi:hypothetical protein
MNLFGLVFVAAGAFSLLGGVCDWEWFMNSRKARFMVTILSRNGARIFYSILGLLIIVFGIVVTMGIIDISK